MDKHVLRIFQREVERQCMFAIIAAQDLQLSLQAGDIDRIWHSIQSAICQGSCRKFQNTIIFSYG